MNDILLSICIPTYNGAENLGATLDNVVSAIPDQYRNAVEVLVSDNCSDDGTQSIALEYCSRYPQTVRYVRNDANLQFNGNVQRCIDEARGKFIHFLGDDDLYKPGGLQGILSKCRDDGYDFVLVPNDWLWPSGRTSERAEGERVRPGGEDLSNWERFLSHGMIHAWALSCILVRRSALSSYEMTNVADWAHLDISLFLMAAKARIFAMPDELPCISIRVGKNERLPPGRSKDIYLSNFRTILDARRFGCSRAQVKYAIAVFARALPRFEESMGRSWFERGRTVLSYLCRGGLLAVPVATEILRTRHLVSFCRESQKERRAITSDDVEVFVLTHNRADMLRLQLQSLVDQTVSAGQITVIDNGSTDDTPAVVQGFCRDYPFVHYHKAEFGSADNCNTFRLSQRLATRKYVAVFHDDDITHPQFIELAVRAINKIDDVVVVSAKMSYAYNPDSANWTIQPFRLFEWNRDVAVRNELIYSRLSFPACIYRTADYKSAIFDSARYGKMFDNPFLFEISTRGVVVILDGELLRYRIHRGSDSQNSANKVTDLFVRNVVARTKELMPHDPVSCLIGPFLLFKYCGMLLDWGSVDIAGKRNVLKFMLDEGILSRAWCNVLKSRLAARALRSIERMLRHRIKTHLRKEPAW